MNNIWSNNKRIEILINVLIYLMSMNFLHYGQLFLPIICLLIFIDRNSKFYVKNKKIFIILCLFGVSFFIFSYYLGFYSLMGFCFPLAYYIGSNINDKSENSIKKIIYLIIFGMVTHYFLNFVYELYRFGWIKTFKKVSRYDIWLKDEFVSTGTATNAVILLSIFYFILFKEKNKFLRLFLFVLFSFAQFYTFIMRRRTQLLMTIIIFIVSFVVDYICNLKGKKLEINNKNKTVMAFLIVLIIIICSNKYVVYYLKNHSIFAFIKTEGLGTERIQILFDGIKYIPKYIIGGQHISKIVGMPFHDLILNIYDYAGIIPMTLMICYVVYCFYNIIELVKSKKVSNNFKLLVIEIFIGYIIMCIMEPLMTGSSLFLIVGILIESCIELLI